MKDRELLIDFVSYLEKKAGEYNYLLPTEQAIDDYLINKKQITNYD